MGTYHVIKPEHGSEQWLAARWSDEHGLPRISASAAAAVHGEHSFTTPADLAVELLASEPPTPKEPNSAMLRGQRLEPVLIEWAAELEGITLTTPAVMYAYREDGVRLISTLDAITPNGTPYEVKTTNRRWDGVLPRYWYWQGVQQAICTESPVIEWVIFDSDLQLHRYTQHVTSDEKQIHIEACRKFLESIDNGMMPENAEYEYRHATDMYPASEPLSVELSDSEVVEELVRVQEQIKILSNREDQLKAAICLELQEAEYGTVGGVATVSWKSATRNSFDAKKFEADHPALAQKYKKQSTYRTFRFIKGGK